MLLWLLPWLFGACVPEIVSERGYNAPIPTYTPAPGTALYDGCAFSLHYPQELEIDGSGWFVFLKDEFGQVFVSADKTDMGLEASLDGLIDYHSGGTSETVTSSVTVVDFIGQELPGLQADFDLDGEHIRIWVIQRPETLLGDMLPETVIYQITATSSVDYWNSWEPIINSIFQSFMPSDCGGV